MGMAAAVRGNDRGRPWTPFRIGRGRPTAEMNTDDFDRELSALVERSVLYVNMYDVQKTALSSGVYF